MVAFFLDELFADASLALIAEECQSSLDGADPGPRSTGRILMLPRLPMLDVTWCLRDRRSVGPK
jgi:hypothetical protein